VVDAFTEQGKKRPSIRKTDPDVWIGLHIENNRAFISYDTSGGSLHRRGYRVESVEAPMQEMLAAAIIQYTEWDGSRPLFDPMCGSGTLLSEALIHYCRVPPGFLRKRFGFENMPDFDKDVWEAVRNAENQKMRSLPVGTISGSDLSEQAIYAARKNLLQLPCGERVQLEVSDYREVHGLGHKVIVSNPPYGIRLGQREDISTLYKEMGDFLKQKCRDATAYLYFGDRSLISKIGLKPTWKKPLSSGGLDGRLVKFEIY
jgi:putative N6-adenine-specific DNA methylase